MAINKNHLFEELDGVKCAVVEKEVSLERMEFLKSLLTSNGYTVVTTASVPPKVTPKPESENDDNTIQEPAAPAMYNVGVTDVTFNATNAIFGRLLRTTDGKVVTMAYWNQKEKVSNDQIPYYDSK